METRRFAIPVDTNGWPSEPKRVLVKDAVIRHQGATVATGVKAFVLIQPPLPGVGVTENPGAGAWVERTIIQMEPKRGRWDVEAELPADVAFNLMAGEIEIVCGEGETGRLVIGTVSGSGKTAHVTAEGMFNPPACLI